MNIYTLESSCHSANTKCPERTSQIQMSSPTRAQATTSFSRAGVTKCQWEWGDKINLKRGLQDKGDKAGN